MLKFRVFSVLYILLGCQAQEEEEPYWGKFIGKFNSYHHQVSGSVYAVDDWTLQLVEFSYDGTGDDTFFWAGDAARPGPHGFIVPDERNKTNVLERYYNAMVSLRLPEGKRVSRLRWLAVYDVGWQNVFADVIVPEGFDPPAPLPVAPLRGQGISSQPVVILDSQTLLIPGLVLDGRGSRLLWWAGVGPQPGPRGRIVPDEYGYLEPLGVYNGSAVRLGLGAGGVRAVHWLAVWDAAPAGPSARASVLLPADANVPPARATVLPYKSALPWCRQLHRDLQISWEVFGNAITIQLAGMIGAEEYMCVGVSGSASSARMAGADLAVARLLPAGGAAVADYNVTDMAPCVDVLGAWRGVCRDSRLGGRESLQALGGARQGGLATVTWRRSLQPEEPMDLEWSVEGKVPLVWAVGPLQGSEPAFHRLWGSRLVELELTKDPPTNDCVPFTTWREPEPAAATWERAVLSDPALRVFRLTLAPRAGGAPALGWLVNGQLQPDLQLRRGLVYTFDVFGGDDPHSATRYHPLVITTRPQLAGAGAGGERVLAGAAVTRRGRLSPTAAGPLCLAEGPALPPRRAWPAFPSFRAFNRSLRWQCDNVPAVSPARLTVTPNSSWPDIVYYHSFTHSGMGGRIFVVDKHQRKVSRATSAATATVAVTATATAAMVALVAVTRLLGPRLR